jgi:hypothetical protein
MAQEQERTADEIDERLDGLRIEDEASVSKGETKSLVWRRRALLLGSSY